LDIVKALFGSDNPASIPVDHANSNSFWRFYRKACQDIAKAKVLRNHQDVVELVSDVRSGHTRIQVHERLKQRAMLPTVLDEGLATEVDRCLDFAARLTTMSAWTKFAFDLDGSKGYNWPRDDSLSEIIANRLTRQHSMQNVRMRFEKNFTAMNLVRIAGLRIVWTWNLQDHLLMDEDKKEVYVFSCLASLYWQIDK
jgi:hypothetical protein